MILLVSMRHVRRCVIPGCFDRFNQLVVMHVGTMRDGGPFRRKVDVGVMDSGDFGKSLLDASNAGRAVHAMNIEICGVILVRCWVSAVHIPAGVFPI